MKVENERNWEIIWLEHGKHSLHEAMGMMPDHAYKAIAAIKTAIDAVDELIKEQSMVDIDAIIDEILRREGGFSNRPQDAGGPTNMGITLRMLSAWRGYECTEDDVRGLTTDEARQIYRKVFYVDPGFVAVKTQALADLLVDSAVLHGPAAPTKWLQKALGVQADGVMGKITQDALGRADERDLYRKILAQRIRFIGEIITHKPSHAVFAAGWLNRMSEFVEKDL